MGDLKIYEAFFMERNRKKKMQEIKDEFRLRIASYKDDLIDIEEVEGDDYNYLFNININKDKLVNCVFYDHIKEIKIEAHLSKQIPVKNENERHLYFINVNISVILNKGLDEDFIKAINYYSQGKALYNFIGGKINKIDNPNIINIDFLIERSLKTLSHYIYLSIMNLNEVDKAIKQAKLKNIKINNFEKNKIYIEECFYEINDMCSEHKIEFKDNRYELLFVFSKQTPIRLKSKGHTHYNYVSISNISFDLNDQILDFFFLLSEVKPRINELIKDCNFRVSIVDGESYKIYLFIS